MPRPKSDSIPALTTAYAAMTADGVPVTVRALAARAGVAGEKARAFLASIRTYADAPSLAPDVVTAAAAPFIAALTEALRDAEAEAVAAERLPLITAAEHADSRAERAEAEAQQANERAARLEAELTAATERAERAEGALAAERTRASTSDNDARRDAARAERAEAEAETLRAVLADLLTRIGETRPPTAS